MPNKRFIGFIANTFCTPETWAKLHLFLIRSFFIVSGKPQNNIGLKILRCFFFLIFSRDTIIYFKMSLSGKWNWTRGFFSYSSDIVFALIDTIPTSKTEKKNFLGQFRLNVSLQKSWQTVDNNKLVKYLEKVLKLNQNVFSEIYISTIEDLYKYLIV